MTGRRRSASHPSQRITTARPRLEELEPRLVLTILRPDHVVIAIEENHGYTQIIGSSNAPYINSLAAQGALFTQSYALSHPSQPNYLQLFSGSNQGVTTDNCPNTFSKPNLGQQLEVHGFAFGGYSETMPSVGYTGCTYQAYARKHNPWVNFTNIPAADNMPYDGYFPSDFNTLPTLSFVIPNQDNDMHNGSDPGKIQKGDTWLRDHLDPYVQWALENNSLFILTFDEDNGAQGNHIATIFVGSMVVPGAYSEHIDHYNVLRTLETMYGLGYVGATRRYTPIEDVWVNSTGPAAGGGNEAVQDVLATAALSAFRAFRPEDARSVVDNIQRPEQALQALEGLSLDEVFEQRPAPPIGFHLKPRIPTIMTVDDLNGLSFEGWRADPLWN